MEPDTNNNAELKKNGVNTGSAKKKNKKKKNQQTTAVENPQQTATVNEDYLLKLASQKFNELSLQTSTQKDDQELKKIRLNIKNLQKLIAALAQETTPLTEAERNELLQNLINRLEEISNRAEEETIGFKRLNAVYKTERDAISNDNLKLTSFKNKLEQTCREMQNTSMHIESNNKQIIEEEEKRRAEIAQSFESNFSEIKAKLEEYEKESQDLDKENEEMREKLKERLKAYEDREKAFMEQLKEKENEVKGNSSKLFDRLKSIEANAREAMEIKEELEITNKNETESKIKLMIYYQKFSEFDETLERTYKMLTKFEQEMERIASRMKTHHNEKVQLVEKSEKTEGAILKLLAKNNNLKKEAESKRLVKEKIQQQCKILQEQYNNLNKIQK